MKKQNRKAETPMSAPSIPTEAPKVVNLKLSPEDTQNLLVLIEVAARHFAATQPIDKAADALNIATRLTTYIKATAGDLLTTNG